MTVTAAIDSDPWALPADVALLTSVRLERDIWRPMARSGRIPIACAWRSSAEESVPVERDREGGPLLVVPPALRLGGDNTSSPPRSGQAGHQSLVFSYRDREEELEGVARRLKADRRAGRQVRLDRTALVVSRALPYLYVARDVFAGAGVPFQAMDTLPLAAEPYAAALDLVIEFVATGFTRRATTALLRSPHFQFQGLDRASISALDASLVELRFLGGLDRLMSLVGEWTAASGKEGGGRERRRQQAALPAYRRDRAGDTLARSPRIVRRSITRAPHSFMTYVDAAGG